MDTTFNFGDLAVVFATLAGPVLAVQAQKWIERSRESSGRRLWIFRTLMATRAANLSPMHVEALNAIPIDFFGRKKNFKEINEKWKAYLDHLSNGDASIEVWGQRRLDLFNDLLFSISKSLGYGFSKLEIEREVYSPTGHAAIEMDQNTIRQGIASLVRGEIAIPIEIREKKVD